MRGLIRRGQLSLDDKRFCECGCNRITRQRFAGGHGHTKGWRISFHGYIIGPRKGSKHILQHRVIFEEHYRCCILPWIECHHINGNKMDNRPENLQLLTHIQHGRMTNTKDMSTRICTDCEGQPNEKRHWYKDQQDGFLCGNCVRKRARRISNPSLK